jgi:hypothetical protein
MDLPRKGILSRLGEPARWAALLLALGCGVGPKHFRSLIDPAPVTRARAVGLGEGQPDSVAIPALIGRLDDNDPVVRLSANEALRKRTGQDFGFVAWADPAERAPAVARWKAWWQNRPATASRPIARGRAAARPRQAGLVNSGPIP